MVFGVARGDRYSIGVRVYPYTIFLQVKPTWKSLTG
jgi:hypothetical protein